jgi:hypothetical protein
MSGMQRAALRRLETGRDNALFYARLQSVVSTDSAMTATITVAASFTGIMQ